MIDQLSKFEETCRERGLKVTHQRVEVFKAVMKATSHPSVEEIYNVVQNKLPTISLDTIYRTVTTLEDLGIVGSFMGPDGRQRYDTNLDSHQHLVCTVCKKVEDIHWKELERLKLPKGTKWSQLELSHVEIKGVCSSCRR